MRINIDSDPVDAVAAENLFVGPSHSIALPSIAVAILRRIDETLTSSRAANDRLSALRGPNVPFSDAHLALDEILGSYRASDDEWLAASALPHFCLRAS